MAPGVTSRAEEAKARLKAVTGIPVSKQSTAVASTTAKRKACTTPEKTTGPLQEEKKMRKTTEVSAAPSPATERTAEPAAPPLMPKEGRTAAAAPPPPPTKERTLASIKEAASAVEDRIFAYCMDPVKKINKEQAIVILSCFKEMRGLVQDTLLRSSFLEGKLEQANAQARKSEVALSGAVQKSLQATRSLERVAKNVETPAALSYADRVKMNTAKVSPSAVRPPKNVVMIFPDGEEGKIRTSEEAREAVFTLVNPRKRGMQVKAVKPIHGNGIAVETTTPEALKELVDNPRLKDAGLQTRTPTVKNPRMIIFDVPREMSEKVILGSLRKQNAKVMEGEENDRNFSLCFRTGRKDSDETNWVAEVSPKLRERLLEANKVFLGWGTRARCATFSQSAGASSARDSDTSPSTADTRRTYAATARGRGTGRRRAPRRRSPRSA